MENIQGMLEEIRGVVHNHFQDENNKIVETMSVLNNLPIVIALRKQVEELTSKNTLFRVFIITNFICLLEKICYQFFV